VVGEVTIGDGALVKADVTARRITVRAQRRRKSHGGGTASGSKRERASWAT